MGVDGWGGGEAGDAASSTFVPMAMIGFRRALQHRGCGERLLVEESGSGEVKAAIPLIG